MLKRASLAALMGVMILALAAPAAAEKKVEKKEDKRALTKPGKAPSGKAQEKWAMVMKIRKRIQQVAMELQTIQKGVVQKNPDLLKRQKELRAMVKAGMKLYQGRCQSCHGISRKGQSEMAEQLSPPPSNIIRVSRMPIATDAYWYWTIAEGGGPLGTHMPAFRKKLSERQIW